MTKDHFQINEEDTSQDGEKDKEEEQKGKAGKKSTCCAQGMGNGAEECQQSLAGTLPPWIPGESHLISEL